MRKNILPGLAIIALLGHCALLPGATNRDGPAAVNQDPQTQPVPQKIDLKIFYVGQPDTDRTKDFHKFLSEHFTQVEFCPQNTFSEDKTANFDVVVLDYVPVRPAPGERGAQAARPTPPQLSAAYAKPTILFGNFGAQTGLKWLKPKTSYT